MHSLTYKLKPHSRVEKREMTGGGVSLDAWGSGGGVLRFRMGTDVRPGIPTTTL